MNLVDKDDGITSVIHFVAISNTDLLVEIIDAFNVLKSSSLHEVISHIELNEVFISLLSKFTNYKRLTDLPSAIDAKNSAFTIITILFNNC